jgi:TonB-linked SusC/RagA family outer membrane protein
MKIYFNFCIGFALLSITVCISQKTFAQNKSASESTIEVKGKVVNENNEPVAATIAIKNSSIATSTAEDGSFDLKGVKPDAVLVVTGVAVETVEVSVKGRHNLGTITITSKFTTDRDVVVDANTGYQTLKPNELNGSITVIDNKTLNQQVGMNILKRLDGVTSGLLFSNKSNNNPQSDLNISIRGLSTINGPLNPLVVLDNFIYEGDINNINPNDIESISVLKDAAATSIYGARGGNGVIVITTKKGEFQQPLKVQFNSTITIAQKPDIFYPSQISSADYIYAEQFAYQNGYYNDQINYDWYYHTPFTPAVQIFIDKSNGLISTQDSINKINLLKNHDVRNDYNRYFYTNAITQQYGITLTGGSNTNAYTFGINYDRNRGALYDQYNKLNIHLLNTYKPLKNLQLTIGAYYTNSTSVSGRPSTVTYDDKNVPYIQLTDENGNSAAIPDIYSKSYTDTAGGGKLLDWNYYPLEDYKHYKLQTSIEELNANVGVNYKIINGLDVDLRYQFERQTEDATRNAGIESFYTRNLVNQFSQVDYTTGNINYIIPDNGIQLRYNNVLSSQNFRSQLNFNKHWRSNHVLAMAGFEIREIENKGYNSTLYGYNSDPLTTSNVDFVNQYPTLPYGSNSNIPGSPYLSNLTNRYVSGYANASYIFKNKYSLSGSVRKDGANIFGVNTNDKWKPLWSAGSGWEIYREGFYHFNLMPYLRLRASYGFSGNIDASKSALPIANYFNDYTTNLPYTRIQTLNNPDLKWEQSRQINIATEFKTLHNVINGTIEFYWKKGTDLYGLTNYDYTTWGYAPQITKNVASMSGKGIDINLTSNNIDKTLKWRTSLLFNYNQSKVTKYFTTDALNGSSIIGGSGETITPVIGKPLYAIAAFKWEGLNDKGDPQGLLDGKISTDYQSIISTIDTKGIKDNESVVFIGSATPIIFGSLINTFSWKKLSVSLNISYKLGYYFKKPTLSYSNLFYSGTTTADFANRWQKPGDENKTNIPSLVYTNYPQFSLRDQFFTSSEINILKADHVRLQYVNLNYQIKEQTDKGLGLRLYVNIANLGILWRANKEKIDPDYPTSIPAPKSYSIGFQATF